MQKRLLLVILFSLLTSLCYTQRRMKPYDGPYIKKKGDDYHCLWIQKGKVKRKTFDLAESDTFKIDGLPKVDLNNLDFTTESDAQFTGVKKFAAISDVHGQHDLFIKLLRQHKIIDDRNQWKYGDGHLIVLGDIMDRGDKVTESLWFLFFLEKQAQAAGGKVHFLLGNHELMVLHGDIGYINPKYRFTSGASRIEYPELYSSDYILGQWLRSKNVAVTINDCVFVHGGFSEKVLAKEKNLDVINDIFKEQIYDNSRIKHDTLDFLSLLYFENGPLWYRGFSNPEGFDSKKADTILSYLNKEHIIVGHTSMPQITTLFNNRIILIDSSIKFGRTGEFLLFEDDLFYRAKLNGDRILLNSEGVVSNRKSVFEFALDQLDVIDKLVIRTDLDSLKANKEAKAYQDADIFLLSQRDTVYSLVGRVKTRGNMRKKLCELPPLKLDFNKTQLRNLGFSDEDKLKLVLQCGELESHIQYMYKEAFAYKIYNLIDTLSLEIKPIDIQIIDEDDLKHDYKGFILEDEENLADRINGEIIEKGVIRSSGVHRDLYIKMAFFQYLISNTDWSIGGRHNIETVKVDSIDRIVAIPYDFDYSGFVGTDYAIPNPSFPILEISQRYFRVKDLTEEEMENYLEFFNELRPGINRMLNDDPNLNEESKKQIRKSLSSFYRTINSSKKKKDFIMKSQQK